MDLQPQLSHVGFGLFYKFRIVVELLFPDLWSNNRLHYDPIIRRRLINEEISEFCAIQKDPR